MKLSKKLLLLLSICYFSTIAYSQKIPILGKDLKSKILCDQCTPGSIGQPMVLDIKPWTPILTDNSNPKQIASQLLGRVYINGDETGDQPTFCSNSLQNPFGITNIYPSGNTGNSGTTIKYKWKKIVKLDVGLQVQTDLDNLKKINPKIEKNEWTPKQSYRGIKRKIYF